MNKVFILSDFVMSLLENYKDDSASMQIFLENFDLKSLTILKSEIDKKKLTNYAMFSESAFYAIQNMIDDLCAYINFETFQILKVTYNCLESAESIEEIQNILSSQNKISILLLMKYSLINNNDKLYELLLEYNEIKSLEVYDDFMECVEVIKDEFELSDEENVKVRINNTDFDILDMYDIYEILYANNFENLDEIDLKIISAFQQAAIVDSAYDWNNTLALEDYINRFNLKEEYSKVKILFK